MCVDDIAVQGADPLFFLDYVGVGRLDPAVVEEIVAGVAEGCRQAGCALVGGEMAEHGAGHSMDLAGFAVGVVERAGVLTGAAIAAGDVLVGLLSPGLRSNGYSLARQVLLPREELLDDPAWEGAERVPGRRAAAPLGHLLAGDGGPAPVGRRARLRPRHRRWPARQPRPGAAARRRRRRRTGFVAGPAPFREVQRRGEVSDAEMAQVFNLGLGMVAVVAPADAAVDGRLPAERGHRRRRGR